MPTGSNKSREMLVRQWKLVLFLHRRRFGASIADLEEGTGVSRATVYRDLNILMNAGAPIAPDSAGGRRVFRLLDQKELPKLGLTPLQVMALHVARLQLEPLAGTGIVRELDTLLGEIRPPQRQLPLRFADSPAPPAGRSAVLEAVERAMNSRRRLCLEYRAATRGGATETIHVEPLLLNVADNTPYLRAFCVERGAERTYKVARIATATVTDARARRRARPAPDAFANAVKAWTGDPVNVRIVLAPSVAWRAHEHPLVPSQHLDPRPDGSTVVSARVAGLVEAARWVLAWGDAAEALEPPELRAAVRDELRRAAAKYDETVPPKGRVRKVKSDGTRRRMHGETVRA